MPRSDLEISAKREKPSILADDGSVDEATDVDLMRRFLWPQRVAVVGASRDEKSVGGVVLGCKTPEEAAEGVEQIEKSLQQADQGQYIGSYLVQEMVGDGVQLAVGVREDPSFGPVLMVGLGGELLELLGDVGVRLTPFSDREAREMIESLKSFPLLSGYRGQPAKNIDALLDLIHRVGALVEDVEEVAELDLNPVFVKTNGVVAADVRLRLQTSDDA
ncbi:MAG: acetate--CoA ligase family protein [Candidatus Paceibacterota bacterium]